MSVTYGSRPSSFGLVLLLDAANIKSYPGAGTTWFDLSGNGYHATLVGSPAFSTVNKNSFTFTGSQTATVSNPIRSQLTNNQDWTVISWLNIDDTTGQNLLNLNSGLFPSYGTNNSLLYLNGGANDYYTYGGDIGALGWKHVAFRFSNLRGYRTIYSNAVNISTSGPNATSTPSGNPNTLTIGSNLRGSLATLEIYNRVLTDSEIIEDFNITRGRYGV